jgi:hypothetical protein
MFAETTGWEQKHPGWLAKGIWIFLAEGIWQRRPMTLTVILFLDRECLLDLGLQGGMQAFPQHCFSILVALTAPYRDGVIRETDILNAETQALSNTKPTAVQQGKNQPVAGIKLIQYQSYFGRCQNNRQAPVSFGVMKVQVAEFDVEHFVVKKRQSIQSGFLRVDCYITVVSRKRQKISTFFPATNRRTLIPSSPTREISYELNRAHTPLATAH